MLQQSPPSILSLLAEIVVHKPVRLELNNGLQIMGRVISYDAQTMNMVLDNITASGALTTTADGEKQWLPSPPQLAAAHRVIIRGSHLRYIDFLEPSAARTAASVLEEKVA
jgi:small nuclear ribonucleoprotein (snRNP)-like protein